MNHNPSQELTWDIYCRIVAQDRSVCNDLPHTVIQCSGPRAIWDPNKHISLPPFTSPRLVSPSLIILKCRTGQEAHRSVSGQNEREIESASLCYVLRTCGGVVAVIESRGFTVETLMTWTTSQPLSCSLFLFTLFLCLSACWFVTGAGRLHMKMRTLSCFWEYEYQYLYMFYIVHSYVLMCVWWYKIKKNSFFIITIICFVNHNCHCIYWLTE